MLTYINMRWLAKFVVLLAVTSIVANAQCTFSCAIASGHDEQAPVSDCHHKNMPDKDSPANLPCSHEVSIVAPDTKTFIVIHAQAFVAKLSPLLVTEAAPVVFSVKLRDDTSPPVPSLSSISILRV
jgi:hypothetical protein